jgi:hypothetical protein
MQGNNRSFFPLLCTIAVVCGYRITLVFVDIDVVARVHLVVRSEIEFTARAFAQHPLGCFVGDFAMVHAVTLARFVDTLYSSTMSSTQP